MKTILTTIIFLLSVISAKADYRPLELYEMILGAEKIVYGELVELDSMTFTLKVERDFTGHETELVIQRFQNWPCAHRWADYKVGQRLFLFLKSQEGLLYSMSGGNEGELPYQNGFVFINGLSLDSPPPRPDGKQVEYSESDFIVSQKHKVHGVEFFGHKTDLKSFTETVVRIRNCFEIEYGKYHTIEKATIKCNEQKIKIDIGSDSILNWTYRKLKKKTSTNNTYK